MYFFPEFFLPSYISYAVFCLQGGGNVTRAIATSEKRKKNTITDKEQEPIFSGGYKPPVSSVSENILKLSNSSFSYSDK